MAKKTVGALVFSLSTDSKKFVSGFAKARKSVNKFGQKLVSVGKRVAKWTAGIVAAGAAIGIYMVQQQFKAIDALAKMADRLGITTEALASYQFAAEQTGTAGRDLTNGIGRLNRMLGDARNGNKTALRSFERLGLTLEDLQTMTTEDAFRATADAVSRMGTVAEKTAVAQELLGRSGRQMINFLNQGSEGFDAMREQAEKLGLTIDRETAAKVEIANDAMNRLSKLLVGIARQVAPHFAAVITMTANKIEDWATSGDGAASKVGDAFFNAGGAVATSADTMMIAIKTVRAGLLRLQLFTQNVLSFVTKASATLVDVSARIASFGVTGGGIVTSEMRKFAEGSEAAADDIRSSIDALEYEMANLMVGGEGSALNSMQRFQTGFESMAKDIAKQAEKNLQKPVEKSTWKMIDNFNSLIDMSKRVGAAFNDLNQQMGQEIIGNAISNVMDKIKNGVGSANRFLRDAVANITLPDQVLSTSVTGGFRGADVSARAAQTEERNLNEQRNRLLEDIRNALQGGVPAG